VLSVDIGDRTAAKVLIGLFKTELVKPRRPWRTLSDVELATGEWTMRRKAPLNAFQIAFEGRLTPTNN
jgi:hypothetical protein